MNLALWTALGILAGFAGLLGLMDLGVNLVRVPVLLLVAGVALGYATGVVMGRKEAFGVGVVVQVLAIVVGYVVYLSDGNPFGWAVIGLGVWGAGSLLVYRRQILEDA